jgi:DoxX-like family
MARSRSVWFPLLGLSFAVTGIDKMLGLRTYERLFRHWGWSEEAMRTIGAAEFAGGVLVATRSLRWLGGLILAGTCARVLEAELTHKDTQLAAPRLALLVAALTALCPATSRSSRRA